MTDPKPVELLTESEKVPLLQAYTEGPIAMLDAVTAIVAAREAAARREALLEAADAYSDFEVFLDTDGHRSMRKHSLAPDAWIRRYSERYTEPERDEEGGR